MLMIICFLGAAQWGLPTGRDLLTGPPGGLEIFAINDRYGAEHQRRDTSFNAPTILCSFVQCVSVCLQISSFFKGIPLEACKLHICMCSAQTRGM